MSEDNFQQLYDKMGFQVYTGMMLGAIVETMSPNQKKYFDKKMDELFKLAGLVPESRKCN